ncbi:MAG: lysophospholipid acyltransferase family protein [Ignavibacteriaceae bacterium]
MTDRIEYIIFVAFSLVFKILGLKISRKFSYLLTFIFFYLIPIRKQVAIDNLKKAFPDYSLKEIKKIAFESYRSFAITLIEILYLPNMSAGQIEKFVPCDNNDFIIERHKENRGVILLSAHFGNWEAMAVSMGLQLKIPISAVIKPQRNELVSEWLNKMRSKWGNKIVPLGISIREIYKTLKDKNIVAMVADQRGPEDGIRVNFFGRKTAIYAGPAALALKTKSPLLFAVSVRQPDYSYTTHFEEISMEDLPGDEEEKIIEISQRHASLLEKVVREHPEQWLWMHKRWKY